MATTYMNVCRYCGKVGGARTQTRIAPPPPIIGKCPSSPNGKHAPTWQPK